MEKLEDVLKNFEGRLGAVERQLRQLVGSAQVKISQTPQIDKPGKTISQPSSSYVTHTPPITSFPKNVVREETSDFDSSSMLGVICGSI